MSAQTISRLVNATVILQGLFCKDSNGQPCQGVTFKLNVVSGDPTGLGPLQLINSQFYQFQCLKPGTYTVNVTATNSGGALTTDAAGDSSGEVDTINVTEPGPATMAWTYQ